MFKNVDIPITVPIGPQQNSGIILIEKYHLGKEWQYLLILHIIKTSETNSLLTWIDSLQK